MPVMKKQILCSLFIASSITFSLYAQNSSAQDNEDLFLILGDNVEEVYPLEDLDTVCLVPDFQDCVHDLEIDPTAHQDIQSRLEQMAQLDANVIEITIINDIEDTSRDQAFVDDEQSADSVHDELFIITKDQLEDILNEQVDHVTDQLPHSVSQIIAIDNERLIGPGNNGIILDSNFAVPANQHTMVNFEEEDDDIIPVPHDLINSVKKANKLKRKLEKKQRKEKEKFSRKSKKYNKK